MVLGLGSWEILLVALALLLFFGPESAPQAIRQAGRMQAKLRRFMRELEETVEREQQELERATGSSDRDGSTESSLEPSEDVEDPS